MESHLLPILLGFSLDLLFGDPVYSWHPVRLIGKWISWLESKLYGEPKEHFIAGFWLWFCAVMLPFLIWLSLAHYLPEPALLIVSTALYYSLFSFRDLLVHFDSVHRAVKDEDLAGARSAVSMIVGRETDRLNLSQCGTAAIESLGENSSDGGVSPLFWAVVGGIPGLILFKVTSTLDSMVGYRNDRYRRFGTVSARLDDVLNFVPARLTAFLILLVGRVDRSGVLRFLRDRNSHASPNAGQVESALAVVIDCQMGGGSYYHGKWQEKPTLNAEAPFASAETMKKARTVIVKVYALLFTVITSIYLIGLLC